MSDGRLQACPDVERDATFAGELVSLRLSPWHRGWGTKPVMIVIKSKTYILVCCFQYSFLPHVRNQEPKAPRCWEQKEDKNIIMQTVSLLTISGFFLTLMLSLAAHAHIVRQSVSMSSGEL